MRIPGPRWPPTLAMLMGLTMGLAPQSARAADLARADSLREAGRCAEAVPLLKEALAEAEQAADSLGVGDVLQRLNLCYQETDRPQDALESVRRMVALYDAVLPPDDPTRAAAWQELGIRHYHVEDFVSAAVALGTALGRHQAMETPDPEAIVWCRADLAEMHRLLGNYDAAQEQLERAVQESREAREADPLHAVLVNNLAALYWDQDRLDEAEVLYRESLAISEDFAEEDPMRLATALSNLGVLLRTQRRWEEAEAPLMRALSIARGALPERDPELLVFLKEPALLYSLTDRFADALPLRREALRILEDTRGQNVLRAELLAEIARDLEGRGDLAAAETAYRDCLDRRIAVLGRDHAIVAATRVDLARVMGTRAGWSDPGVTREVNEALRVLGRTSAAPEATARALGLRARAERAAGRRAEAMATLEESLARIEELRGRRGTSDAARQRFLAEHLDANDRLIEWRVEAGDAAGALQQADAMRARILEEELLAGGADLTRGIPEESRKELQRRERDARIRISVARTGLQMLSGDLTRTDAERVAEAAALETDLDAALRDLRSAQDDLRLLSPAWREIVRTTRGAAGPAALRDALAPGEALLYYRIGTRTSFVFVVPPGTGEVIAREIPLDASGIDRLLNEGDTGIARLHSGPGLQRGVGGVRRLDGPERGADAVPHETMPARWHRMWRTLLPDDVWDRVAAAEVVVIVPDGALHALPFEALVTDAVSGRTWLDDGPVVHYGHSLATLTPPETSTPEAARDGARRERPRLVVTLSDPDFGSGAQPGLPRLPGTAAESGAVLRAFPITRVVWLSRGTATEPSLRRNARRARYLHIATHGILDRDRDGWLSGLALGTEALQQAGPTNDGFLHLFEIPELRLDCDLAVLSACETRAGRIVPGEGVFALSRAFHTAGARQVIASLWPLEDQSAAALVGRLFELLAAAEAEADGSGRPPDAARILRDAKRDLRATEEWQDPHFWAPFVTTGAR